MIEQTEHPATETGAAPGRISLDDFIEAPTRGLARPWATQDDVSGHILGAVSPLSFGVGFVVYCPPPPSPPGPRAPVADRFTKNG